MQSKDNNNTFLLCIGDVPKVMEAVERFKDPLSAAKHIVQESFRTWLRYEVRTDDITIIVMFIDDFTEGTEDAVRLFARYLLQKLELIDRERERAKFSFEHRPRLVHTV